MAVPVRVNVASAFDGGPISSIAAPATNHTTGNRLAVHIGWEDDATGKQGKITDTAGNVYTKVSDIDGSGPSSELWVCASITGNAANVVTATFRNSADTAGTTAIWVRLIVVQYSGGGLDGPINQASGNDDLPSAGNLVTTDAEGVLFMGVKGYQSVTYVATANWTLIIQVSNEAGAAERFVTSTGTYNTNGLVTTPAAQNWTENAMGFMVAFVQTNIIGKAKGCVSAQQRMG